MIRSRMVRTLLVSLLLVTAVAQPSFAKKSTEPVKSYTTEDAVNQAQQAHIDEILRNGGPQRTPTVPEEVSIMSVYPEGYTTVSAEFYVNTTGYIIDTSVTGWWSKVYGVALMVAGYVYSPVGYILDGLELAGILIDHEQDITGQSEHYYAYYERDGWYFLDNQDGVLDDRDWRFAATVQRRDTFAYVWTSYVLADDPQHMRHKYVETHGLYRTDKTCKYHDDAWIKNYANDVYLGKVSPVFVAWNQCPSY